MIFGTIFEPQIRPKSRKKQKKAMSKIASFFCIDFSWFGHGFLKIFRRFFGVEIAWAPLKRVS